MEVVLGGLGCHGGVEGVDRAWCGWTLEVVSHSHKFLKIGQRANVTVMREGWSMVGGQGGIG